MKVQSVAFFASTICAAAAQQILLFSRNLDSLAVTQLGSLHYDPAAATSDFSAHDSHILPGSYCIGTSDLPLKECFVYLETSGDLGGEFVVFVDDENQVSDISFLRGAGGFTLRVEKVVSNVKPNLTPFHKKEPVKEPVTQKVTRKRVVENENGEKVEIEEEVEEVVPVDERSWIQRNWMYVVPPLLLFLVMAPEDKQE